MDIKNQKVEFEKRVAFLIDNGKYDACKDAIECFIINFWREELFLTGYSVVTNSH